MGAAEEVEPRPFSVRSLTRVTRNVNSPTFLNHTSPLLTLIADILTHHLTIYMRIISPLSTEQLADSLLANTNKRTNLFPTKLNSSPKTTTAKEKKGTSRRGRRRGRHEKRGQLAPYAREKLTSKNK